MESTGLAEALSRHLYIAGTGRAGTSFLVRYLTAVGMDTTLSRKGDQAGWSEDASAGLEQTPYDLIGDDVPYVVKSPWLYLVADELIAKANGRIDGLIVPVRDLYKAARSRSNIERRNMLQTAPWLKQLENSWDVWAKTPGGVIYSLDETDEARLLAVGFHILIERFVAADIPIIFIYFPRIVTDPDYLYHKLKAFLPQELTPERARQAFAEVVDLTKVHEF